MSGAGAESVDTLMCMRRPHRAWDTWGEGRRVGASGQEWQCAPPAGSGSATVPEGFRKQRALERSQRLHALAGLLPDPVWVIVSTSLLCSDARHPTLHSRRRLWRQLIRHGFPFWKLGATRGYQGEQFS
jgi:hypothetical protein